MAVATFVQEGDRIDYTPEADVAAGTVVDLGTFVGISLVPIPANTLGCLSIEGVFDVDKFEDEAIGLGDPVYWDVETTTASGTVAYQEAVMGVCIKAALAGDATVRVKLTPGAVIPAS